MPYKSTDELPESVKVLPKEAQEQFLSVVNSALEQYEGNEEKAFATAWASIKQKWKKEDDKWIKKESFSWVGDVKFYYEKPNIRGKALHPIKTVHPEEWPSVRVYLEEELQKSAETLTGQPLLMDHLYPLNGKVLSAKYEDGAIEYIASLEDPAILSKIRDGQIKHCSVEFEWQSLDRVNGVAVKGINFVGLSLLENYLPGDPLSSVQVWEAIVQRLKEAKRMKEAEWDTEYINNLPDECFAYIESGGKKDEQGKTVPRSLRHLPFKNAQGEIDKDHLTAALQALGGARTGEPLPYADEAKPKLCGAVRAWNEKHEDKIASEVCDIQPKEKLTVEAIVDQIYQAKKQVEALQNQLTLVTDQKKTLEDEVKALKEKLAKKGMGEAIVEPGASTIPVDLISRKEVAAKLEAIIPPPQIMFSHGQTGGFKRLADEIRRVKWEVEKAGV